MDDNTHNQTLLLAQCMLHPGRPVHVLVVDDMDHWPEKVAETLCTALCKMGVNSAFTRAETYDKAVALLATPNSWDILVTDISLGDNPFEEDCRGLDLVKMANTRGIPAIAMSVTVITAETVQYNSMFDADHFFYVDKREFRTGMHQALLRILMPIISRFTYAVKA